ncbi:MAG TPA: DUF2794 domain-containing protein [Alphaproteobacteria bacterium]|nr:DUF2794 domain-containing protein [Alphaproteobacteria bacterium]
MSEMLRLADFRGKRAQHVFFNRQELRKLLDLYSRRVASGEWKDYAIDQYGPMAVFSIFRHSFDRPLFAIVKRAAARGCEYVVFSDRRKLKHGRTIDEALSVLERRLRLIR